MSTTRGLITAAVATAMAMALVPAAGGVAQARAKSWHIIGTEAVENARLSADAFKSVDPRIKTVEYRKGGEGNIEVCNFERTERISASRQARWDTGTRKGSTLILQFRNIADGGTAFSRLKTRYVNCTSATFGGTRTDRITVKGSFLKKKKQVRLVWTLFTSDKKETVVRSEGLSIKRAGGALIITRSITKTLNVRTDINLALTARQFSKYKNAAFT